MNENDIDQEIADFRDWLNARLPTAAAPPPSPFWRMLGLQS